MYERLAQICQQADKRPLVKVLVFQGAGDKAFASGTDINQFRAFTTPQHALDYEPASTGARQARDLPRPDHRGDQRRLHRRRRRDRGMLRSAHRHQDARMGFPIARTLGNCLSMSNISRLTALVGPARVKD